MKITESRLNRLINECFDEVISEICQERNAQEKGMSDDEVIKRRIEREKNSTLDRHLEKTKDPWSASQARKAISQIPDERWDYHRLMMHDFRNNHFANHDGGNAESRFIARHGEEAFNKLDGIMEANVSNGTNLIMKMQELVNQANQAYEDAKQRTEDDACLMGGRDNPMYGLVQPIKLQRGSVVIVTKSPYERDNDTETIRCFKTVRGVTMKVSDEEAYPYGGYQYALKRLRQIIRDAQRGIEYNSTFDPNWDEKTQQKYDKKFGF